MTHSLDRISIVQKEIHEVRRKAAIDLSVLTSHYRWNPEIDLRLTSLRRLVRILIGLDVSFSFLVKSTNSDFDALVRIQGEEKIANQQYLLVNEVFLKMSFVSGLFFVVESSVREYLRYLDLDAYDSAKGIMAICKELLERQINWGFVSFDCHVFNFLRLIRNALHNNGVHYPYSDQENDITIKYRDKNYSFERGKVLDFVTWELLALVADDLRSLLFHLAHNQTINSVSGIILDPSAQRP